MFLLCRLPMACDRLGPSSQTFGEIPRCMESELDTDAEPPNPLPSQPDQSHKADSGEF